MTIVDIHCHTFNADDLPVRGFLRRTKFDDSKIGDLVSVLADKLTQGSAPGYAAERKRLDRLLGVSGEFEAPPGLDMLGAGLVGEFEAEVDRTIRELSETDPELLTALGTQLVNSEAGQEEGVFDAARAARRMVRWVKLYQEYRVTNTALLIQNFQDAVDLYTPLIVDLDAGLHDRAGTSIREQVELHEKISRLSMLGLIDGTDRAQVHPFVGFDPRREVIDRRSSEVETALDVVKLSIEKYGCVGVKLYPPMGFKPTGNERTIDMDDQMAKETNDVLDDFFTWCEEQHVPITAHCNRSNEAHDDYINFSAPSIWKKVLQKHPKLHLNLGHFGGAKATTASNAWPWQIAKLATPDFEFLFADVGNHKIYDDELREGYFGMLNEMFEASATAGMADRLMFGSDWFMLAAHKEHEDFLEQYRSTYHHHFGQERTDSFMGGAALRFMGFDDAQNKNAKRLANRYKKIAPHKHPNWLAAQPD